MSLKLLVISNYRATHTVRPEAEIMIGLAHKGLDITIMTYGDSEYISKFKEAGIRVIDYYPVKRHSKKQQAVIRQELISGQYDIMHLFSSRGTYNGIPAAKGLAVKVILYRGFEGHIKWYDPSAYIKFLNPRVDAILCNSEGVAEYVDKAMVFVKNKTVTINKGHKLEWYEDVKATTPAELGLPADAFYAVCAANIRKMKGIPYLLESFKYLPKDANIHLLLLGKDFDSPKNLKIVEETGQADKIHFLGWRQDSLRIVKMANTFMLSSLYGESITKSVLESMSLGTPAIITNIPGNRELIIDGESGYVVPKAQPKAMAEALLKMAQTPQETASMGLAAKRRIATRFSNARSVEQYYEFYHQMVKS